MTYSICTKEITTDKKKGQSGDIFFKAINRN